MTDTQPLALFVMGPTASGKTDLALKLYDHLDCELISVDSALVYRGMDIGTAKPDATTLARYPHRLVDIRDPAEPYSAADFREDCLAAMAEITARGRIPLLVGGTMLYYKVLLEGLAEMPAADERVRRQILDEAAEHGWPWVHQQLQAVDPQAAARINPNDPQRLQRALEIWRVSGRTMSEIQAEQQVEPLPYRTLQFAVAPQARSVLHERIALRFTQMLEQGFIDEVQALRARGDLDKSLPAIRAVGYRQVWEYLDGDYDYAAMVEKGIIATRQLAKRQFTWLRRWQQLHWVDSLAPDLLAEVLKIIQADPNN